MITDKDVKELGIGFESVESIVEAIASDLEAIQISIPQMDLEPPDDDEDGEPGLDVRLRVFEGGWEVLHGDSQYDTDHRGRWGLSFLSESSEVKEIARELLADLIIVGRGYF